MKNGILLSTLIALSLWANMLAVHAQQGVCQNKSTVDNPGGKWEKRSPAPLYRSETSAAVLDGKIYIAGGLAGKTNLFEEISTSFEVYDPAADTWKELAPIPNPLHHVALAIAHAPPHPLDL